MSDALELVFSLAIFVGFAAGVCALGDLIKHLTRGRSTLGAFHVLAWLPALFVGVFAWRDPKAQALAWLYLPLLIAAIIYGVAFTYAAFWAGLPLAIPAKVLAWFRSRRGA